jgi:UPF0716 protein FxsA
MWPAMRKLLSVLLLLFLLAEIATYILVGRAIGVLPTLALTLTGMAAGILLLRRQGLATLARIRTETEAGRVPGRPLFEGALQAVAALLMLLPGFLSDIAGLLLFVPAVRAALWRRAARWASTRGSWQKNQGTPASGTIDLGPAEYRRDESPWRGDGNLQP